MNHEKYKYSASDTYRDYVFDSEGPKGQIRKIVRYSPQNSNGITYFNLGFGDLNSKTGKIDDLIITNNKDWEKILSTVAATVLEFTQHFPDVMVYAQVSTQARTRLYQIGISANWDAVDLLLYVCYEQGKGWQSFRKMSIIWHFWSNVNKS